MRTLCLTNVLKNKGCYRIKKENYEQYTGLNMVLSAIKI